MSRRENSRIERQLFTEQPFVNNRVSHSVSTCINPVNYYNYTLLLLQSTSSYERKAPLPSSSSSLIGLVDNNDRVVEGAAPNACRSPSWRRKSIISRCVIAPIRIPLLEKTEPEESATSSLPSFLPPSVCPSPSSGFVRTVPIVFTRNKALIGARFSGARPFFWITPSLHATIGPPSPPLSTPLSKRGRETEGHLVNPA